MMCMLNCQDTSKSKGTSLPNILNCIRITILPKIPTISVRGRKKGYLIAVVSKPDFFLKLFTCRCELSIHGLRPLIHLLWE